MVRKMGVIAVSLCLLAGVVGCATVDSAKDVNGLLLTVDKTTTVAHLNGESWGIYLLPIIPLLSGDTASGGGMAVLTDTCRVDEVVKMVTRSARDMGATTVADLQSDRTSIWIPPVFWYKSVQVSANAVK